MTITSHMWKLISQNGNSVMLKIHINLSTIKNDHELHGALKKAFNFPEFYGNNIHALIDCLSSLRYPEDEMTGVELGIEEQLILEIKGASQINFDSLAGIVLAIENVNNRELMRGRKPSILVQFI